MNIQDCKNLVAKFYHLTRMRIDITCFTEEELEYLPEEIFTKLKPCCAPLSFDKRKFLPCSGRLSASRENEQAPRKRERPLSASCFSNYFPKLICLLKIFFRVQNK